MTPEQARSVAFNPLDLTKVWPYGEFPLIDVGKLVLDRNADNYFAEVEQSAFDPANFVPGIGPSPDKMLQGRLFAYGDAHRYRLGINHSHIPVNSPHATTANNYGRDGSMRVDGNGGRSKNYEPNSFGGPIQTGEPLSAGIPSTGVSGSYEWDSRDTDDFQQAGDLYRLIDEVAKERLTENIAASLSAANQPEIVDRSVSYFINADSSFGTRLQDAIATHRANQQLHRAETAIDLAQAEGPTRPEVSVAADIP